ncbi:putative homeobox domain-containing protein [Erysiphe necator]|uniref:Putative homeobox domain-containing protein n=1 Tax=Uncinula necator TaxID=52586 RepID=A0A0B1PEG9_UNCNE|nr:putative homeobox domain-containing protein [Erysiphe necator]
MPDAELLPTRPDWRDQYSSINLLEEQSSSSPRLPPCTFSNGCLIMMDQDGSRSILEQQTSHTKPSGINQLDSMVDGLKWNSEDRSSPCKSIDQNCTLLCRESASVALGSISSNSCGPVSRDSSRSAKMENDGDGDGPELELKNEEEELEEEDDDDMIDVELEEGLIPKSEAERRAERRKMKRFRLTHQQTRFLMSEFAKQAHPDAAHRERLSREIPGLSPRQVQVWFQNRRAKIKRLTADDRDRIIKMRAVPENFDNVKALHSSYGAVHMLSSPLKSPVGFGPSYSEHLMRPLVIDSTKNQDGNISPTVSSPAFSHVAFSSNSSLRSPDLLSASTTLTSPERYYSTHISGPMSAGPRATLSFNRPNNILSPSQSCHPRHVARSLQPSQLRDTISKLRPDSLQSPLRLSMSWKGENLNYCENNSTGQPSPQFSEQQPSQDQHEFQSSHEVDSQQFDPNTYSNSNNIENSPTNVYNASPNSSSFLENPDLLSLSRIRATSTNAFPGRLDVRNQFQPRNPPSLATPLVNSFGNSFTPGFVSASPTTFMNSPHEYIDVSNQKLNHLVPEQVEDKLFDTTEPVEGSRVESTEQCQGQLMTILPL